MKKQSLSKITDEICNRVLELACEIQQIPAPSFDEGQRADFMEGLFRETGFEDVWQDDIHNVFAKYPTKSNSPGIVVSAHLDTVFSREVDMTLRKTGGKIIGPGIGDNSVALASLIGLKWLIDQWPERPDRPLYIVANVCEEGVGNLTGMKKVVETLGDRVVAYIVLEGLRLGEIVNIAVGSERYRLVAKSKGGHSWLDYGNDSAIHALVKLTSELLDLKPPVRPKTTFNIGRIEGGISINTIAGEAQCLLDIRSENSEALNEYVCHVTDVIKAHNGREAEIIMEKIGSRPAGNLSQEHHLIKAAKKALTLAGCPEISCTASSTDANIPLSQGIPALSIGMTHGGNMHTMNEYIETASLTVGLEQLIHLVDYADRI